MIQCILDRVLVELEDLQKEHDLGDGRKLLLAYGDEESRRRAALTQGTVIAVGPCAFTQYGYTQVNQPVRPGDVVQFGKFVGKAVTDPDNPSRRLALLNDEDVLAIIKSKENTNE